MCSFVVDCTGSAVDGLETILSLQHLADCAKRHDTAVTLLTAEFQNHKNGPVSAAVFCLCCTLRCMHERARNHDDIRPVPFSMGEAEDGAQGHEERV